MTICMRNLNFWVGKGRIGRFGLEKDLSNPKNPDNPEINVKRV